MSVTKFALLALLLFAQSSAWAVEFGITRPHALGSERQSYFERPDILQVEGRAHPELRWQAWRQAHLEAAAAFLELYPTEHLYFLARDAELLYDALRFISRDDPQTLARLHLLNVSRGNMRHEHLLEYLAQEGITPKRLRSDPAFQPIFIDTGFSGTIPRVIAERMPLDLRLRLKTHLLVSSNSGMPSLRSFLLPVNPAINGISPSSMHGTIIGYEHIARATDRSDAYQQVGSEWHPTSPANGASADGQVNASTALHYQEDLKAYLQNPEVNAALHDRRTLWHELRSNWLTLSKEEWTEYLRSKLENSGEAQPQIEASVRDFLEWIALIGRFVSPNAPILPETDIGLSVESGATLSNKASLISQFPQWAAILENPAAQIPELLDAGQVSTVGAILDVVQDEEIRRIALRSIAARLETPQIYALAEALIENIKSKNWVIHIFKNAQMTQHPELLRLAIEKAPADLMSSFADYVFRNAHWANHPELLRLAIEKGETEPESFGGVFTEEYWRHHPELLRLVMERVPPKSMRFFASHVLNKAHWSNHPELIRFALEKAPPTDVKLFASLVLNEDHWKSHPQITIFIQSTSIPDLEQRRAYLREQLGPSPWETDAPDVCEQQMTGGGST